MNSRRGLSCGFVRLLGIAHLTALLWLCSDWDRDRLLVFKIYSVRSDAEINLAPRDLERHTQDDPQELGQFREIAEASARPGLRLKVRLEPEAC